MSMSMLDFSAEYGVYICDRCGNRVNGIYEPDFPGRNRGACPNCDTPGMRFSPDGEGDDEDED